MIYRFDRFELDIDKAELRADGRPRPVEPQVFALLALLVEHRERLVSRDEILEKLWDRRVVTESTLGSRIKSARRVLGDDGRTQKFIKTTHGRGLRFVADVEIERRPPVCRQRRSWIPGRPTISDCSTCIASIAGTMREPPNSSPMRSGVTRASRAHAGLSFVHFQSAFLRQTDDIQREIAHARGRAQRAIDIDPLDPFTNFTMGRSFWLNADLEGAATWLEPSTSLSPDFAQGIYARAWTEIMSGNSTSARESVDMAMRLSPLDPLYYAMVATRGLTHIALKEYPEAALWTDRAARSPGAHVLIAMIGAAAQELAGDRARARNWAANVRARDPSLTRRDFFRSFPLQQEAMRAKLSAALETLGF